MRRPIHGGCPPPLPGRECLLQCCGGVAPGSFPLSLRDRRMASLKIIWTGSGGGRIPPGKSSLCFANFSISGFSFFLHFPPCRCRISGAQWPCPSKVFAMSYLEQAIADGHARFSGKSERELDDRTHDEFPERSQIPVPGLEFRRNTLERLELV